MPRFAANLSMLFSEVEFLDRFGAAAAAGFHAVEFAYPYAFSPDEIADRVHAFNLEVVLFNAPPGNHAAGERGLASLPGRDDEFAASITLALRYATALNCKRLHVMAGVLPAEADAAERDNRRSLYIRRLRDACVQAAQRGVTVLIEPLNPHDAPHYLLSTQAQAHKIREEVGAQNLMIQLDLYHAQRGEGELSEQLQRSLKHVGHIQIAGFPGRHEPDVGEIHYPWLFRLIDDLRYEGWIGCEYRPLHNTEAGLSWLHRWQAGETKAL